MSAQDSVTSMSPGEFGEDKGVMTGGRRRRSGVRKSRKTRGGKKPMNGGKQNKTRGGKRRRKTRGGNKINQMLGL